MTADEQIKIEVALKAKAREAAEQASAMIGLDDFADAYYQGLRNGFRQAVSVVIEAVNG